MVMKRCPTCDRTYGDDSITFCLDDGTLLSASYDLQATQRIPARLTNPQPTEVLTSNPPPTQPWQPNQSFAQPVRRSSSSVILIVVLLAVVVGGGIIALVKLRGTSAPAGSGMPPVNANRTPTETRAATDFLRTPWLGLEVSQGGKASGLFKVDLRRTRIPLSREPFEIKVPRLPDNPPVLIAAWKSDGIFSQLKEGEKLDIEATSFFNPYKAMADTPAGSATLMLDEDAHYVYDDERLKSISESQSTIFISSVLDGDERSIKDQKDDLYLVVFRDLNKNEIVENGEYEFLVLDF
jgi:hypothetical protein